ncbi:hypothetical protein E5F92_002650 [Flavobacterium columnare]|uniref:hypothetical protein n=1 Tax=Flavobacterium columnare TaxID=996 RepID=UPI002989E8D3|nr:hypothetical protein [Flavobacterium columnare]MCH4831649.1 hypothetical protein [Flavobacterium columnare]
MKKQDTKQLEATPEVIIPKLICGLTDAQIEALKRQHGFLVIVDVVQGGTTYNAIFKEPTFAILEATGSIGKNNEIKAGIALYENCVLAVDKKLKAVILPN